MFSRLNDVTGRIVPTFGRIHHRSMWNRCNSGGFRIVFSGVGPRPFGVSQIGSDPWWEVVGTTYFNAREAELAAVRAWGDA